MSKRAKKGTTMAQDAPKSPRHQPLPGMEGVRHSALDRLCEGISEVRAIINANEAIDAEKCREAQDFMRENKIKTYRFAGVELARVPGEEKLRVRTSKEKTTAEVDGDDSDE